MARVSTGGPFPAIRPDESDFFTFDFTKKIGPTGSITGAVWSCVLATESPPDVVDTDPQSHVLTPKPPTPVPPSTRATTVTALCGNFVQNAVYTLSVVATIDDGRTLVIDGNVKSFLTAPSDILLTVDGFREDYPAFADAGRFPDEEIQHWIDIACAPPNSTPAVNKYRWGQFYQLGLELFVAHNLAIQDMMVQRAGPPGSGATPGGYYGYTPIVGTGVVASKSVNGVSLSYDNQIGMEQNAGWWGQTPWGNQYLYYLRLAGT